MPKIVPANNKTGTNLVFLDKEDHFLIKVMKDAETRPSNGGRADILASSEGWLSLTDLSGDDLSEKEVGINLTITTRDKPKRNNKEKSKTTKKPK